MYYIFYILYYMLFLTCSQVPVHNVFQVQMYHASCHSVSTHKKTQRAQTRTQTHGYKKHSAQHAHTHTTQNTHAQHTVHKNNIHTNG